MSTLPPYEPPKQSARRFIYPAVIVLMIAAMAAGAWFIWGRGETPNPTASAPGKDGKAAAGKGGGGRRGGPGGFDPNRAQPVQAAPARRTDINVVQTALGTANALRTVVVKPRVDGQLQNVLFTEGQMVKQGDTLAQIDPIPFQVALAQQEGQLARDAAQLNNARLDLERYRKLLAQDSIATQQVDQQASLVRQLEGTVKVDEAQVANAKLQLSYTQISAPISGKLGLRQVDAGNMVRGSDANGVAVITQVDPIAVVFTIPQDTLPRVLARLAAGDKPAVEAWDREQKSVLAKGTLITTDNQIDVTTGTVKLKAEFPNKEGKLFPNQFVNVRMVVEVRRAVVTVPSAAIQRGTQGTIVYVVKEDSTVGIRPVTTGPAEGTLIAVESGLEAGERVITDGVDRIREGSKVEVTQPQRGGPGGPGGPGGGRRGEGKGGEGKGPPAGAPPKAEGAPAPQRPEGAPSKPEGAPAKPEPAPRRDPGAPGKPADAAPKGPGNAPPPGGMDDAKREEMKKKMEGMSPEERREFFKKRMESMTPEQREEFMKRRRERQGQAQE